MLLGFVRRRGTRLQRHEKLGNGTSLRNKELGLICKTRKGKTMKLTLEYLIEL